jgi:hypothetical protein
MSEGAETTSGVRRRKLWFFETSTRVARVAMRLTRPARRPSRKKSAWVTAKEETAFEAMSMASAIAPTTQDQSAAAPAQAPSGKRRPFFPPLVALGLRSRSERDRVSDPKSAASVDGPSTGPDARTFRPGFGPSRAASNASRLDRDGPPLPNEDRSSPRKAYRTDHGTSAGWVAQTPEGEIHLARQAPSFAAPRSSASRDASRRFAGLSDDRWPALPPSTFAPPPAVEAPSPRWDQLAREQEEGRWSV